MPRTLPLAFTFLTCVVVFAACQSPQQETASTDEPTAQTSDEWTVLFDGTNMDHWRGFKRGDVPSSWTIADGAIHFDGGTGERGDIITKEAFDDFELTLEWKIGACGNSGIFYGVSEDQDATYFSGPEMQVLDNTCHPDAENGLDRTAGANYALHVPSEDVTKPAGEWNEVRLVVNGPHVEHWLNGVKVVEFERWTDDWKERVANSKFAEWEAYGMNESGHIALQDHSDPVWYRNIKIRSL